MSNRVRKYGHLKAILWKINWKYQELTDKSRRREHYKNFRQKFDEFSQDLL